MILWAQEHWTSQDWFLQDYRFRKPVPVFIVHFDCVAFSTVVPLQFGLFCQAQCQPSALRGNFPQTILSPSEKLKTGRGHGAVATESAFPRERGTAVVAAAVMPIFHVDWEPCINQQQGPAAGAAPGSHSCLKSSHQLSEAGVVRRGQGVEGLLHSLPVKARSALTRLCMNCSVNFCS